MLHSEQWGGLKFAPVFGFRHIKKPSDPNWVNKEWCPGFKLEVLSRRGTHARGVRCASTEPTSCGSIVITQEELIWFRGNYHGCLIAVGGVEVRVSLRLPTHPESRRADQEWGLRIRLREFFPPKQLTIIFFATKFTIPMLDYYVQGTF